MFNIQKEKITIYKSPQLIYLTTMLKIIHLPTHQSILTS